MSILVIASINCVTAEKWMDQKGFKTLEDFRGKMSYARTDNPAAYERTQFMVHFAGKDLKR